MSSVPFSRSLVDAAGLTSAGDLDFTSMVRILRAIDARLMPLENQSGSLDAAIAAVRKVGLDRINEVLVPAIQLILEFQSKGFLIARSSTPATLGNGNILTLIVGEEQGRAVFTPAPFIALTREATADDYAICRTISYVQESGVLVCEVIAFAGAPGPHADWVIGALAGSTIAQQTMLAAAEALLGDTQDARDAAMGYRNQAASHVTSAADEKDLAIAARNAAETAASASAGARNTALTYRDQAAASAAIAASAAGQALDVLDRVDIAPSLVLDFTDPKGAPYKGNFTRATGGGYARRPSGLLVPTGNNEPVIDYGADGKTLGTGFFGAYTNILLNSAALSTQTVAVSALTYTLSFRGAGSVTLSGAATGVLAGVEANSRVSLTFAASAGTLTVTAAGGVVEASLTATAYPVPYVPTTSAAVVRNADTMIISGSDFTDFFNPLEGTIFADCVMSANGTYPNLVQFDSGTPTNRHTIAGDTANARLVGQTDAASVNQSFMTRSIAAGTACRAAYSYKANDFDFAVNGSAAPQDTAGTLPSGLSRMLIATSWNNYVRRIIYWPKALSATDLQRITA